MVFEKTTTMPVEDVLAAATRFFAQRDPARSAFPEKAGPGWALFRGQGGEEIALAAFAEEGATRVRGSSLLFDQLIDRFFSTLPATAQGQG